MPVRRLQQCFFFVRPPEEKVAIVDLLLSSSPFCLVCGFFASRVVVMFEDGGHRSSHLSTVLSSQNGNRRRYCYRPRRVCCVARVWSESLRRHGMKEVAVVEQVRALVAWRDGGVWPPVVGGCDVSSSCCDKWWLRRFEDGLEVGPVMAVRQHGGALQRW
nr:hypothetical protein Iba_scaffold15114CG0010 [Ipomoea batatas]